jgi:hypothetical protein
VKIHLIYISKMDFKLLFLVHPNVLLPPTASCGPFPWPCPKKFHRHATACDVRIMNKKIIRDLAFGHIHN